MDTEQDDLKGLDIVNGHCYNASVPQNLTFGYQGLPFGLSSDGKKNAAGRGFDGGLGVSVGLLAVVGVGLALVLGGL